MNETIIVKHPWKIANVILGYKYYKQSLRSYRISTLLSVVVGTLHLAIGIYIILSNNNYVDLNSLFFILSGIFLLFINKINFLYFVHRIKQLNYENKQLEWEIDRDKIVYRMLNSLEITLSWKLIKGILDTPEGFLIFPQHNVFYWLPKNAFDNESDIAHFVFIALDKVKNWQQVK